MSEREAVYSYPKLFFRESARPAWVESECKVCGYYGSVVPVYTSTGNRIEKHGPLCWSCFSEKIEELEKEGAKFVPLEKLEKRGGASI